MAQFSTLYFNKMKSFLFTQSPLGPIFDWKEPEEEREPMQIALSGPFDFPSAFLDDAASNQDTPGGNKWRDGQGKILAVLRDCLLEADAKSGGGFVLRPPDFDSQNAFADELGNVTGLVDWDLAHTFPRCLWFAAYPEWITRTARTHRSSWPRIGDITTGSSPRRCQMRRNGG